MDGAKVVCEVRKSSLIKLYLDLAHPLFKALLDDLYRF